MAAGQLLSEHVDFFGTRHPHDAVIARRQFADSRRADAGRFRLPWAGHVQHEFADRELFQPVPHRRRARSPQIDHPAQA